LKRTFESFWNSTSGDLQQREFVSSVSARLLDLSNKDVPVVIISWT